MDFSFMEEVLSDEEGEADEEDVTLDPEVLRAFLARFRQENTQPDSPLTEETPSNNHTGGNLQVQRPSDDDELRKNRRGTGRVLPTRFMPPSPTTLPSELFVPKASDTQNIRYESITTAANWLVRCSAILA